MDRYIRLEDNTIFDIQTTKRQIRKLSSDYYSKFKNFKLTHDKSNNTTGMTFKAFDIDEQIWKDCGIIFKGFGKLIAENNDIRKLLQVGDLVCIIEDDISKVTQIRNEYFIENLLNDLYDVYAIYTKQGNNFVLVWTKEKGVI